MALHLHSNTPQHNGSRQYKKELIKPQDQMVAHQNNMESCSSSARMHDHHTTCTMNSGDMPGISKGVNGSFNQRQQGTVEKLLHSYGFIDSEVQKEGHLFFHYSEFVGDIHTIVIGDCVEFNLSYDYRSSRWLAVSVTKVESALTVSKEQFSGQILVKAQPQQQFKSSLDRSGRISYEQSGECFYIPFSIIDLQDETKCPETGDRVTFFIATDKKTGHMWATCVTKPEPPPKSHGVVCSLKENFGFIERADVVKEIFFHYSEYAGNIAELVLGDDVEFNIQTRNGKEVATTIGKLPEGTVVFEDVNEEKNRGKIAKVIKATRKHAEPLAGAIVYETAEGTKTIPYSERDITGEFTLFAGDVVDFQIAKDRRDGLLHATNVILCDESFIVSKERRDKGVISSVKESYGFLQLLTADSGTGANDSQLFFHFNELYEATGSPVIVGDEVEFTVAYDPGNKSKPIAIRIRKLPQGTIRQEQVVSSETYTGTVTQDQPVSKVRKPTTTLQTDFGLIKYMDNNKEYTVMYLVKDADLRFGDKVSFNVCESKRSKDVSGGKRAINIKLISRLGLQTGFLASLKDSYGFIETIAIDDEIFFHYSCYQGDANELEVGDVVEFSLACRNKKVSAENVRKAPNKIQQEVDSTILLGKVTQAVRQATCQERDVYSGLIQAEPSQQGEPVISYPFGVISLANKRVLPTVGVQVEFQVARVKGHADRAVNVVLCKDQVNGRVDSVKGSFGFVDVEERDKKIYFNMSDVLDKSGVSVGDSVQCVIVPVAGTNKLSAVCLKKVKHASRPERLVSKLKTQMSMTEGPKLIITRQPRRPNGKGFAPRQLVEPKTVA